MDLLAETNSASSGRWVLMPRKGHRFLGPRDRYRARIRRRRRFVLTLLCELTLLTLIIGLFPPLRPMLVATAVFGGLLLLYLAILVRVRADALRRARVVARKRPWPEPSLVVSRASIESRAGDGRMSWMADGQGDAASRRHPSIPRNRHRRADAYGAGTNGFDRISERDHLLESGVRLIGDDVHVTIRKGRSRSREAEAAMAESVAR